MEKLKSIDSEHIKEVRGIGLMIGIEVEPEHVLDYIQAAQDQGLLVLKAGTNTIRLLPPLIITKEEIDQAAQILKGVLQ